jgi:hypothetical protein
MERYSLHCIRIKSAQDQVSMIQNKKKCYAHDHNNSHKLYTKPGSFIEAPPTIT